MGESFCCRCRCLLNFENTPQEDQFVSCDEAGLVEKRCNDCKWIMENPNHCPTCRQEMNCPEIPDN